MAWANFMAGRPKAEKALFTRRRRLARMSELSGMTPNVASGLPMRLWKSFGEGFLAVTTR